MITEFRLESEMYNFSLDDYPLGIGASVFVPIRTHRGTGFWKVYPTYGNSHHPLQLYYLTFVVYIL